MTDYELREKIAFALKNSTVGLKISELRRKVVIPENRLREEVKKMCELYYLEKIGVTALTRYNLTPQGRLMFITNNESPLAQTEKTPVEMPKPAPIVEESPLEQIAEVTEIEAKPYPFVTDSIIEDFETRAESNPVEEKVTELLAAAFESFAEPEPVADEINSPAHYHGETMQVIDVIDDFFTPKMVEGYLMGNVLKYVLRYQKKGGVQSLKKAQWYLNRTVQDFDLFNEV